jgi:hypothetical protein
MKKLIIRFSLFSILGALGGFGYYYFIGCKTGSCPITGNPYISTFYGLFLGIILGFDPKLLNRRSDER